MTPGNEEVTRSGIWTSSIRFACFRRLQPLRFFSSAISGTTLTTVSLASPDKGALGDLYLALLGSHTILAVVIVPLVLTTLHRAWRGWFDRHKRIARWTLPLWFYVSVTGVVVYWMLYHLHL